MLSAYVHVYNNNIQIGQKWLQTLWKKKVYSSMSYSYLTMMYESILKVCMKVFWPKCMYFW